MVVLGAALLSGGLFMLVLGGKGEKISPTEKEKVAGEITPTVVEEKDLTWKDEAGFIFQYSPKLEIDNHPEDKTNYANLEITAAKSEGKILILAKDSPYKTLDEWIEKDKSFPEKSYLNVLETKLGGKTAKKITPSEPAKTIIGAIDENILFTVELSGNDEFLKKEFEKIISSFEFFYPTEAPAQSGSASGSSAASGEDVIEEEEIIE